MITILVLSGSSLQAVIVYQVENQYAKACMNYDLKCVLSENIKNRTKVFSTSDVNVGLIVGLAITLLVVVVMAIILVLVAVHITFTKLKKHMKELTASFPTDTNQAYGVATPCEEITFEKENMYNYPEVVMNSAHAGIATEMNEAYIATNITTDKNLAYGSFSKSETDAESDYVYEFILYDLLL